MVEGHQKQEIGGKERTAVISPLPAPMGAQLGQQRQKEGDGPAEGCS